jgi:hypothetical protein
VRVKCIPVVQGYGGFDGRMTDESSADSDIRFEQLPNYYIILQTPRT